MRIAFSSMIILLLAGLLLLNTGCQTENYYQAQAVERARKYALSELKDLPETQRDYIRYAPPEVMEAMVFQREKDGKKTSKRNLVQKCIVWKVPGLDYDIVVYGVSSRKMIDWYPEQLIKKRFVAADPDLEKAKQAAVVYAMNHLTWLSDHERNRIRFSDPLILSTCFPLYDEAVKDVLKRGYEEYVNSFKEAKADLKKTGKSQAYFRQTSFIWKTDKEGESAVVTGISKGGFGMWAAVSGKVCTQAEIEKCNIFKESAVIETRQYAVINLPRLSNFLISEVRSKDPVILSTDFKTDALLKPGPGESQVSFVWDTEYRDEKAVITGFATQDLKVWKPFQAKYVTVDALFAANITERMAREKAIAYAEKCLEGLDDEARKVFKIQTPLIMRTDFDLEIPFKEKDGLIEQRSFVWDSGAKDKLIVVVGTSAPSMAGWLPDKTFFSTSQELSLHNVTIKKAIAAARKYAQENIQYISYKEENRIITERPKIYETDFDIPAVIQNVTGSPGKFVKPDAFLQWSFVWDSDDAKNKVVISGAGRPDFSEWTPVVIFLVDNAELERSIFKDR